LLTFVVRAVDVVAIVAAGMLSWTLLKFTVLILAVPHSIPPIIFSEISSASE
jgi:hypothetical protein